MALILSTPKYTVIEKVAAEFAAVWWEAGRSSGLKSKHKTARLYAKKNFEKFIPKAIEHLTEMLDNPHIADLAKQEIYEALMERANDPVLKKTIVDLDLPYKINGENPFKVNN